MTKWIDEVELQSEEDAFDELVKHTWEVEGGFSNHDSDPGGATMYGITEAVARAHGYTGGMKDLPESFALSVYRKSYFEKPGFHLVAMRSLVLAKELFDCGVNTGPPRATMMLQRALNLLNQRGRDWADLKVDGALGGKTMEALDSLIGKRGKVGKDVLLKALLVQRGAYYMDLAAQDEKFEDFLFGWLRTRVDMELICHG